MARRLPPSSGPICESPVTIPPGRDRLAMKGDPVTIAVYTIGVLGAACPVCPTGGGEQYFPTLPREAGEGDHAEHGGGGILSLVLSRTEDACAARPLHRPSGGPPPPLRVATRGRTAALHRHRIPHGR